MARMLKIQLVRSTIGRPRRHKQTVKGLGFRRLNQVITVQDTPEIRGMINKVPHLVRVLEELE